MKRKIIEINEELCDGCGNCVTGCSEGALQIINGKAKVVNERFCDGMGDCMGHCPAGALKIIEREADEFNLKAVEDHLRKKFGEGAVSKMKEAQLKHSAGRDGEYNHSHNHNGCPSARFISFNKTNESLNCGGAFNSNGAITDSELRHWPIQLHLVSARHPDFKNCDLLLAADCTAFSFGGFHRKLLKGKTLAIACPKLDNTEGYIEKLTEIFKYNNIKSLTCAVMEVPCCSELLRIVNAALAESGADITVKTITIGIDGCIKDISV